ncbi:MAG TPA: c-type cytochrome [Beijerinckiaceae bacterium]|nr:c-type cytochrome [Beijerinckiaceae bacterium]
MMEFLTTILAGLLASLISNTAFPQDVMRGKDVFSVCAPCHAADDNGIGPKLAGIVNRQAGSVAGFRYSRAMENAKISWDDSTLDAYLADPQKVVPGNLMPFSGIAETGKRADLIAYLKTLK